MEHAQGGAAFRSTDAAAARHALDTAWAILRHDAALYPADANVDRMRLYNATRGHLGCALPGCTTLCANEQVVDAIVHIERLAAGTWLTYDLGGARTRAIAATSRCAREHPARGSESRTVFYLIDGAWRPYIDTIHQLHGRLWATYAPFWALLSRADVDDAPSYESARSMPPLLATVGAPLSLLFHCPPTPREVESRGERCLAQPSAVPQTCVRRRVIRRTDGAIMPSDDCMEIDQGAYMAASARLRAMVLTSQMARGAIYPARGDTSWAASRRDLAVSLEASPDTQLVLVVKERRHALGDGSKVVSRTVSLRGDFAPCPFARGDVEALARTRSAAPRGPAIARAHITIIAAGPSDARVPTAPTASDPHGASSGPARSATTRHKRISPNVACMQRLCVGQYNMDKWLACIARRRPEALYTLALLADTPTTTYSRPARPSDVGFCAAAPGAIARVTTTRREMPMDGCLVAALVRDAIIVQPIASAGARALFVPPHRSLLPSPDCAIDRHAAVDGMAILCSDGTLAGDVAMFTCDSLATLRYAVWYACRGGGRDGYDLDSIVYLLDRARFQPNRAFATRLALLWS